MWKPSRRRIKARSTISLGFSGLVEAVAAVDIITRQKLETRNRIALILLDSNFEIALKEFVVHRTDLFPPQKYPDGAIQTMFGSVFASSKRFLKKFKSQKALDKAKHYYALRNKLILNVRPVGITDADVNNYRSTIEEILTILFGLGIFRKRETAPLNSGVLQLLRAGVPRRDRGKVF